MSVSDMHFTGSEAVSLPEGIVTKAVNGFFTVRAEAETRVCKARGVFRKRGIQVLVGDRIEFDTVGAHDGVITHVHPRRTELARPPVANVDQAILVNSCVHPDFQAGLLDRMLVSVSFAGIEPLIVVNKVDMAQEAVVDEVAAPYRAAGYEVLVASAETGVGMAEFHAALRGKVSVFVGPSGVGKSSLANAISPELGLKMGEISEKLGRGKHTTRHAELFEVAASTFVVDAPGFSQLDVPVMPADVRHYFREFTPYAADCPYRGCLHADETDCAVKAGVARGDVSLIRYENYLSILAECKEREVRRY